MDMVDIPSGNDQQFATQKMAIDIVDLPSYNMVIFHSCELCQFTRGYLAIDGNITKGIQKDMQSPPMMDTCGVLFGMIELMTDPIVCGFIGVMDMKRAAWVETQDLEPLQNFTCFEH